MITKSLNYAYPRKYAEGGDVVPPTRTVVSSETTQEPFAVTDPETGNQVMISSGRQSYLDAMAASQSLLDSQEANLLNERAAVAESGETPPASFDLGTVDNSMITGLKGDVIKQANGRYTFVTYDNAVGKKEGDFKGSGRGTHNNLSEKEFAQMTGIPVGELTGDLVRNPEGQLMTAAMGENDDMPPPRPDGVATTRMVGEEEGMDGFPPPGMATTMAMGEEEGGLPLPKDPGGELTTMAMGEEDGGLPFPPPENPVIPPPSIDPPIPQPIAPPPNTGYAPPAMPDAGSFLDMYNPPSVVGPEFSPLPVAPDLPQGGSQGRTYGAYSQAGQQAGTTMQPFTPYTPPPQNEGIRSLIDEPVSYLTESGPRSSVFRRS